MTMTMTMTMTMMMTMTMTMMMLLGMEQALSSFVLDQKVNIDECFSGLLFDIVIGYFEILGTVSCGTIV